MSLNSRAALAELGTELAAGRRAMVFLRHTGNRGFVHGQADGWSGDLLASRFLLDVERRLWPRRGTLFLDLRLIFVLCCNACPIGRLTDRKNIMEQSFRERLGAYVSDGARKDLTYFSIGSSAAPPISVPPASTF